MSIAPETAAVISPEALLEHWQGHRRLTRRVIDAFPEDQLFTFTLGGIRPFGMMALEMLVMAAPMVRGIVSEDWAASWDRQALPKADLLREWDEATAAIDTLWAQIPLQRFQDTTTAFGQFPGKVHDLSPVRDRQRGTPPRSGLRIPARPGHRAPAVLRPLLIDPPVARDPNRLAR
jgi:hypothetical protein